MVYSPETYFQSAFRVQSPWSVKNPNGDNPNEEEIVKPICFVFDFAPTRAMRQLSEYAIGLLGWPRMNTDQHRGKNERSEGWLVRSRHLARFRNYFAYFSPSRWTVGLLRPTRPTAKKGTA